MTRSDPFVHDLKNYLGIVIGYSNLLLEELPPEDPRRTDVDEIRKAGEAAIALVNKWSAAVRGDEER
jgi:two-component system cell cycle sensor histidine kinase/response regulator CckA